MNHSELLEFTFFRGRVGLYKILESLGIGKGHEVITQAYTCVAVPEGILASGATPVYVDIDPYGYTLDPNDLQRVITDKTRAIIVQHTFGLPADMGPIIQTAQKHNLMIIEDCCHTVTSKHFGQTVGTFGKAAFYSFEYGKPYPVGAGGSVFTLDPQIKKKLKEVCEDLDEPPLLTQYKIELQALVFRYLYKPSLYWFLKNTFQALSKTGLLKGNYNAISAGEISDEFGWQMGSLARQRLTKLIQQSDLVNNPEDLYLKPLNGLNVRLPITRDNDDVRFIRYPIQVSDKKALVQLAQKKKVEVADWYRSPVHPLEGDKLLKIHYAPGSCPNAEKRSTHAVSLPLRGNISNKYIDKLVKVIKSTS